MNGYDINELYCITRKQLLWVGNVLYFGGSPPRLGRREACSCGENSYNKSDICSPFRKNALLPTFACRLRVDYSFRAGPLPKVNFVTFPLLLNRYSNSSFARLQCVTSSRSSRRTRNECLNIAVLNGPTKALQEMRNYTTK